MEPILNPLITPLMKKQLTLQQLIDLFKPLVTWEERYRQLILLSRQLSPLTDELKTTQNEINGCENRVWLTHSRDANGKLHFSGDSEGRIVKGLLAVLLLFSEGKTTQELLTQDPLAFFELLGITQQLSASRNLGLQALSSRIQQIACAEIEQ